MKAITIFQPYASLIAIGVKRYETRSWETSYRGPIAIHAGMNLILPHDNIKLWHGVLDAMPAPSYVFGEAPLFATSEGKMLYRSQFPLGAIIATAELVGCWEIKYQSAANSNASGRIGIYAKRMNGTFFEHISENERLFGDWTPGRYAWELANVQMLSEPVAAKGKQRIWEWTP